MVAVTLNCNLSPVAPAAGSIFTVPVATPAEVKSALVSNVSCIVPVLLTLTIVNTIVKLPATDDKLALKE